MLLIKCSPAVADALKPFHMTAALLFGAERCQLLNHKGLMSEKKHHYTPEFFCL
ncbi:hypothetical protein RHGRI_018286 [Rhododendron griersonianum]|uniref:Uncharacterized protein n=1 Tax=Rhododendron griersonianum TaxID=479676 RepID=A0AAV6IVC2_9ERIC|nr:hypothetical protein RHGRI_027167 [Rhododendron griersonianum]KAG5546062.1 hypothetical protein RHGRI_018286 [Rhododendron griersonianum]